MIDKKTALTVVGYLRNIILISCVLAGLCGRLVLASEPSHLQLIDHLDRPVDGYCVDVHGTSGNLRTDLPLFAHNCKATLTSDSAVVLDSGGAIRFVDLDLCITVAGVNSAALPGAAVILRECGESGVFFETQALQQFTHRADDLLELNNSGLCLAVGVRSGVTYASSHRWRPLFVDDCASAESSYMRWRFIVP